MDLQFSVRGQNRSESHQEDTCDNTKMKQAKTDVSKLKKYPFQVKQALRKFSEAAQVKFCPGFVSSCIVNWFCVQLN